MPNRVINGQGYLFAKNCRDLAESIGLDWWAAKKLYDDKWLSFDPAQTTVSNDCLEAEFRFLGSLVANGCDPHILKRLLAGLEKPYCYDLSRMYYDWTSRKWKDLPRERDPQEIIAELITTLEEDSDTEGLNQIGEQVRDALNRMQEEDISNDRYDFDPEQSPIILAAKQMLWKIASSSILDTPEKKIVVGKLFRILQRLPNVSLGEELRLDLTGPRRNFGNHEIYHWWTIELDGDGRLCISSGGHFYRPETGGDSFSSMSWEVNPGFQADFHDYLHTLNIVDDADTFENEVVGMRPNGDKYKVSVEDSSLEDLGADDVDDDEEKEQ